MKIKLTDQITGKVFELNKKFLTCCIYKPIQDGLFMVDIAHGYEGFKIAMTMEQIEVIRKIVENNNRV